MSCSLPPTTPPTSSAREKLHSSWVWPRRQCSYPPQLPIKGYSSLRRAGHQQFLILSNSKMKNLNYFLVQLRGWGNPFFHSSLLSSLDRCSTPSTTDQEYDILITLAPAHSWVRFHTEIGKARRSETIVQPSTWKESWIFYLFLKMLMY